MAESPHSGHQSKSDVESLSEPGAELGDFDKQMALLSMNTDEISRQTTTHFEEARMAPVFTAKAFHDTRILQDLSEVPPLFPLFGLLGGGLEHAGERSLAVESTFDQSDPRLFLNVNSPWSTFVCGSQGSGKSHTLSCMLENCLSSSRVLGNLGEPLAGLVFHYDYDSEQKCEAAFVHSDDSPVRVLVPPSNFWERAKAYEAAIPGVLVQPFLLKEGDLTMDMMMSLMAVNNTEGPLPLYIESVRRILRDMSIQSMGRSFKYKEFKKRLKASNFDIKQTNPLGLRLELLDSFLIVPDILKASIKVKNIWKYRPGTLTIVDLSGRFVDAADACLLFQISLSIFLKSASKQGTVVALDEAHKFMGESAAAKDFTESLLRLVRDQRHNAARVIISTQEPTISPALLDLSSMIFVHRFTSPSWMRVLQSHLAGISMMSRRDGRDESENGGITELFKNIVNLNVGEAFMFSPTALLGLGSDRLQRLGAGYMKVRVRQRITEDGGRSVFVK
ncbi:MAG: hypothetical protein M4579_005848 [Chaenotheca gracillima]|nr:MAG: hypothetical protein M4579_005848 [Chaenotheca gracillima]